MPSPKPSPEYLASQIAAYEAEQSHYLTYA